MKSLRKYVHTVFFEIPEAQRPVPSALILQELVDTRRELNRLKAAAIAAKLSGRAINPEVIGIDLHQDLPPGRPSPTRRSI